MRKTLAVALSLLWIGLLSPKTWAWSEHHLITAAALKPLTDLSGQSVVYSDFSQLLAALGYANPLSFNEAIRIRKEYRFAPKLGEKNGQPIKVLDVLAKYSDEPDWGMDQELFGAKEYPQLWDPAYAMMGGKNGTPSQAFRHMYWQKFDLLHPLKTFKLPLRDLRHGLGFAPERAQVFLNLSRRARALGQPYWAVRFLADALHYLEDCSQPYHTTQVPTKEFLFMPLLKKNGDGLKEYVQQLTQIVSYYHFAFEDYVSNLMLEARKNEVGQEFDHDLSSSAAHPKSLSYADRRIDEETRAMARIAVMKSSAAGRASLAFFPPITENFATFSPEEFMNAHWWTETRALGERDSKAKRKYFAVVRAMFAPLGYAIRQVVTAEIKPQS